MLAAPEIGFLFPAFEDRSTNIYSALYYTRDIAENHQEFVDAVFHCEVPMPAAEQKETFESILGETLAEDCSYDVVQSVHGQLSGMIEEHKANKEVEPLVLLENAVKRYWNPVGCRKNGRPLSMKNMIQYLVQIRSSVRGTLSIASNLRSVRRTSRSG